MSLSAYDPEAFRNTGHRLVDALADYLTRAQTKDMPVLPVADPNELFESLAADFPEQAGADLVETLLAVVARSNHLHHPGYVGHQVATVFPTAALIEMVNALLNNGMAVYEMGQMQTVMERKVLRYLAQALDFPEQADGVLTHGGSIGNFTALLAARQARAGHDVWSVGRGAALAVLVSDQAHYSVARAVQCMGWGAGGAIAVSTDERFRLRPDALASALRSAQAAGRKVIAVVASSCSTATGSFDPLAPIADFCTANELWMHVDGAHGASLALSRKHRGTLAGIERADSVVWDLHKLMGLPALATAVLFRDGGRSYEAFAQEAGYLFEAKSRRENWYDVGMRTMECTKRGMGVTAYAALQSLGTRAFEEHVDRLIDVTHEFAEWLRAQPDFEIAVFPEANILCFRHLGVSAQRLDEHQARIRAQILRAGHYYIVQTSLRGELWLRVTVMNPLTSLAELRELIFEIRAVK